MAVTECELLSWPRKSREIVCRLLDSRNWNGFPFRRGDVVIATWAKSGTTWVQQIVKQLILDGDEDVALDEFSPWIDIGFIPQAQVLAAAEAQRHRRCLKTHLPVEALVMSPDAKYLFVGRDGRDVVWSLFNHFANAKDRFYELVNGVPGTQPHLERPTDIRSWYHDWLDKDGFPVHPFWSSIQSWWNVRHLPNVLLLHFNDLKSDLGGTMRAIAAFLDVAVEDDRWPVLMEHCTFEYMKGHAEKIAPFNGSIWKGGGRTFIDKGTNGRWRELLTPAEIRKYDDLARMNLSADCARWLATGGQ